MRGNRCRGSTKYSASDLASFENRLIQLPKIIDNDELHFSYRFRLFELLKNCILTRICLFCVKTKIDTPTHMITYNTSPTVRYPFYQHSRLI